MTPPRQNPGALGRVNNARFVLSSRALDLLRVQGFKLVRASGNAPDPGTHLVRLRL